MSFGILLNLIALLNMRNLRILSKPIVIETLYEQFLYKLVPHSVHDKIDKLEKF